MAAAGPESAKAAANYSDGLITFLRAKESHNLIEIFDKAIIKKNNGENNNIEKIAEYKVSYSEDYDGSSTVNYAKKNNIDVIVIKSFFKGILTCLSASLIL